MPQANTAKPTATQNTQEQSTNTTTNTLNQCDVLVIGAGPAGLSFAKALEPTQLNVVVLEKNSLDTITNPAFDGREIALTHASKEMMQQLGLWQLIPEDEIYQLKDAKVIDGNSPYSLHFPQPNVARGKPTDRLGYLIANHHIRAAAYQQASQCDNVTIVTDTCVTEVKRHPEGIIVSTDDEQSYQATLLVAADSRFSRTRSQLGISADMHDFGRTAIVFRIKNSVSNNNTALECFHYGRTLALLPLNEHLTNCVITAKTHLADQLLKLSAEQLAADIMQQLKGQLGNIELASSVHSYPLMGVHANNFVAEQCALIGDAAVGMHPVTAHGFNLGLQSAVSLAKLISQAKQRRQSVANMGILRQYERQHMLRSRPLYHGTNAIVGIFTNDAPPVKLLRKAIIHGSNRFPPIKKLIAHQLTG